MEVARRGRRCSNWFAGAFCALKFPERARQASVGASMSLTGQGRAGVGGGRARREEFKLVFSGASCAPHNCFGQVEFYISISKTMETQKLQLFFFTSKTKSCSSLTFSMHAMFMGLMAVFWSVTTHLGRTDMVTCYLAKHPCRPR